MQEALNSNPKIFYWFFTIKMELLKSLEQGFEIEWFTGKKLATRPTKWVGWHQSDTIKYVAQQKLSQSNVIRLFFVGVVADFWTVKFWW